MPRAPFLLLLLLPCLLTAAPPPSRADLAYGPHERNRLDLWLAASDRPTPLVLFIHGGGFVGGDKSKVAAPLLERMLGEGVSYAAINYRFLPSAPIQDILRDAARAVQFLRAHAAEYNLDKERFAAHGGSAGAGTSLWLAFHDDLADPDNPDPVLRESTRLVGAGASATQFSYDLLQWEEVLGVPAIQYHAPNPAFYGLPSWDAVLGPQGRTVRADVDMRGLITPDDPPVWLLSTQPGGPVTSKGHLNHHPAHALAIQLRCAQVGVPAVAYAPALGDAPKDETASLAEFLLSRFAGR
ncbi:MAG: alpha/beta hydrolase fold domain-containing protein [Acidobacteria bacterium]|nr:alpha/beta hydrolase fold domain-containing protein [Acidobacteriota bacterium]